MHMTADEAKAICRHLGSARRLLGASAPASDSHVERISAIENSLNPDSPKYVGDTDTAAEALKQIYADLGHLKEVQPVVALVGKKMPNRKPPSLLSGVADAMVQITKASELLQPHVKGNASM